VLEMFGDCTFVSFVLHDVSFTSKRNISLWNESFLTNGNTNFIRFFKLVISFFASQKNQLNVKQGVKNN